MNKSSQYNQQTKPKQCKSEAEEMCILPKTEKWPSRSIYHVYIWKINGGFHARKNPKQHYLKVVTFSDTSFSKKHFYVYDHAA